MELTLQEQALLEGCFLFEGVEPEARLQFCAQGRLALIGRGEVIYSTQQFHRALGLVLRGSALVQSPGGVPLNTLVPGSCFGVAALFHPTEHYVSTITAQADALLCFFTDVQLEEMFRQCPRVARNYIAFLSERIEFLNEKIGSFTAPSALAQVARYLVQRGPTVQVPSYTKLATQLNLGRASLYRALDFLAQQGHITRQGGTITLLDIPALTQLI